MIDFKERIHFNRINYYLFSHVVLLVLFLISIFPTVILSFHDTFEDIRYQLHNLVFIQWGLFAFAFFLTAISGFWQYRKEKAEGKIFQEMVSTLNAIYRSQAIIEFNMDGTIITANDKFLEVVGYPLHELKGRHHNIMVEEGYRDSAEYREFWEKLNRGKYIFSENQRIRKNGVPIWLQACYTPIMGQEHKPLKVVKVATDITERKNQELKILKMANSLKDIIKQIAVDSNSVSTGINQLKSTAMSHASSAAEQAASISEISTTIEEIKTTAKQTLEKAKLLGESAKKTNVESEKGQQAIEKMNDSMTVLQEKMNQISSTILSLNDKTQQISEITETVADIARQSKMLALNASIEAAKAGESGKGFTVVASEVKELAEKSQLSTELVQKILQDIRQTAEHAVMVTEEGTKSVDFNTEQVKITGHIILALGEVIESNAMAALQIVSSIREEAVAMEQIDLSMKEVDKVTTVFTSASEQTKEAIVNLSKVCESLNNTASHYKE